MIWFCLFGEKKKRGKKSVRWGFFGCFHFWGFFPPFFPQFGCLVWFPAPLLIYFADCGYSFMFFRCLIWSAVSLNNLVTNSLSTSGVILDCWHILVENSVSMIIKPTFSKMNVGSLSDFLIFRADSDTGFVRNWY